MADAHLEADLDISVESLLRECEGNVANLPSFMVHDNHLWNNPRLAFPDTLNRVHMRRSTFLNQIAHKLPLKPGVWLPNGIQHFHMDIQPHHLGGSADMKPQAKPNKVARVITKSDPQGRTPEDWDYGHVISEHVGVEARRDTNVIQLKTGDRARGADSDALTYGDTEDG